MFKALKELFSGSGRGDEAAPDGDTEQDTRKDTEQGYTIDRGSPGNWELQEVYGPGDEGLIRCSVSGSYDDDLGVMIAINDAFELEIFIGSSEWRFPEGGFFSLRLEVDDGPVYEVFAMTANPFTMFIVAPQSMEFFDSLKHGTDLIVAAVENAGDDDVFVNSIGDEVFKIRLRNTAEALEALYDCACAAVPPEVAEKSFYARDPLKEPDENEPGMNRMLAGVTELTKQGAEGPSGTETQDSGDEEARLAAVDEADGLRLLNPLLQASINNRATDLKDFIIDVDALDEADRQGRPLTWTVGDVKGEGLQYPTASRMVDDVLAEFMEECRQRGGDELAVRERPGLEFVLGAQSETRMVLCSTPGRQFTAVCTLIPAGLVSFRITHSCDGHSDRPVNADARLVHTMQAVMQAFLAAEG